MNDDFYFEDDIYLNDFFKKSIAENKKQYDELISNANKYEEYLFENLDDEKLEIFEKYIQVLKELRDFISAEAYRDGYKMCIYSIHSDNKKAK